MSPGVDNGANNGGRDGGALYSVAQVRAFDQHAIQVLGVPGYTLMTRAAEAALQLLCSHWPRARRITVFTGGGNNGGDGLVLARLARAAGLEVTVLAMASAAQLRDDARRAADDLLAAGGELLPFAALASSPRLLSGADVIVDALLGSGLHAAVRADYGQAIEAINASGLPVLALDLPSGLDGDSGAILGAAVRANCTITFVGNKTGLYLGEGPGCAGAVTLADLQLPAPAGAAAQPVLRTLSDFDIARALPPRPRDAHKGNFGRVLIIGAGPGMPGAVRLAGESCLRSGAGIVVCAIAPQNMPAIADARPELICIATRSAADIHAALASATVVAIGPGLGLDDWARELYAAALAAGKPLVIDADALTLLAQAGGRAPPGSILTPHPGEAARLLGVPTAGIQKDRLASLQALVAKTQATVVLKGAGTLIGMPGQVPALCTAGNPGMAAPGMGDVLTGLIAGIRAQCGDPWLAARAGVQAHARAGDALAQRNGARGLLALELAAELPHWLNTAMAE
jgi:ADP-dependent NAD(P)H-hydrate dehydratase / NAD(P)H-hydrate epimerase